MVQFPTVDLLPFKSRLPGTTKRIIIFLVIPGRRPFRLGSRSLSAFWTFSKPLIFIVWSAAVVTCKAIRGEKSDWESLGGYRKELKDGKTGDRGWRYHDVSLSTDIRKQCQTSFHGVENNRCALEWHNRTCMLRPCFVGGCSLISPRKPSQKPALWDSHSKTDPQTMGVFGMRHGSGHHAASWR
jgi:hypothetical protein